jgi:hypothetical protein
MAKLIFPSGEETKKASRLVAKGELYRVRQGIYIDTPDPEEITKTLNDKWMEVACNIFDSPVAVARTAAELKPAGGRLYFVSSKLKARRAVRVRHLNFDISPGNASLGVEQASLDIKRSNPARYCLENLVLSRGDKDSKKTLGDHWVESELVKIIRRRGELAINELRDEANGLSASLGLQKEFKKLNAMIASLLKTNPVEGILQTRAGIAEAKGEPFDQLRLARFIELAEYLKKTELAPNIYEYSKPGWRT